MLVSVYDKKAEIGLRSIQIVQENVTNAFLQRVYSWKLHLSHRYFLIIFFSSIFFKAAFKSANGDQFKGKLNYGPPLAATETPKLQ